MHGQPPSDPDQTAALLRSALVDLLIDEQELLHVVKPNLEAIHLLALGALELRQLQEETRVRRLRLTLDRLSAALQAGRTVDIDELDRQIELELAASLQRIRTFAAQIGAAGRTLAAPMTDADESEFKRLHRALLERAHPELHAGADAERDEFWRRVCEAYARHSVADLWKLSAMVDTGFSAPLVDEVVLRERVSARMRAIAELRKQPPFTLERWLSDETWLAGRRAELEDEIARLSARADTMEAGLARLRSSLGLSGGFGRN